LDIAGLNKKLNVDKQNDTATNKVITENETTLFTGFIAQEVEQAAKDAGYNFSGIDKPKNENDLYGLRYAEFVVPLVKAMQEQQAIIMALQKQVDDAKAGMPKQIRNQEQMTNELKMQNGELLRRVVDLEKKSN
jgi:trimeric autotransporter adhesin